MNPRGTMDEVSSRVCLDHASHTDGKVVQKIVPPRPRILWWKGPLGGGGGGVPEEKQEP